MPPTVLVAWDPARAERSAVGFGLLLARALRARVLVAGVASPADELAGVEGDEAPDPPRALAGLAQQLRRVPQAELRLVRAASPAAGLLSLIESESPTFTVLGSARGAPHGRAQAGATAGRVLHGATGPVVIVPRGHAGGLGPIAVGLLPTPDGLRALRLGASLAASARVPIRVI